MGLNSFSCSVIPTSNSELKYEKKLIIGLFFFLFPYLILRHPYDIFHTRRNYSKKYEVKLIPLLTECSRAKMKMLVEREIGRTNESDRRGVEK